MIIHEGKIGYEGTIGSERTIKDKGMIGQIPETGSLEGVIGFIRDGWVIYN